MFPSTTAAGVAYLAYCFPLAPWGAFTSESYLCSFCNLTIYPTTWQIHLLGALLGKQYAFSRLPSTLWHYNFQRPVQRRIYLAVYLKLDLL